MKVAVCIRDEQLRDLIESDARDAGHQIERLAADDRPAPDARVLIVGAEEDVERYRAFDGHVLVILTPGDQIRVDGAVSDFAITPLDDGELGARLEFLAARPGRAQEIRTKLLATAVDSATDIIEMTNPDAVWEYLNPAWERVLGYPRHEALGMTPAMLVRSDMHEPGFFKELDETLRSGKSWTGVLISRTRDGEYVHLETTISPISEPDGTISHHVAVKRDITERLERERALAETNRALEQARDAAVAASRAKSEFLANMSHELRTPLNAILGYSEMLMEDFEGQTQVLEDLRRIRFAGNHLLALINDVLDISKIEADKIDLHYEQFALSDVVDAVSATIGPLATQRGNQFSLETGDLPAMVCDRTRLRQILLNLLSNATKFTKDGAVTLQVESDDTFVTFHVRDTGIGISDAHQKKLFQPFVQADSSTTREYGGTGLGLVITKRLCELMGGSISLESESGSGSTFTVRLPLRPRTATGRYRSPAGDITGPLILVIDDDDGLQELVSRELSRRGYRVICSATGEEGLRLAHELKPAAIVLDVKLPGMSGWDVLSNLKLTESTASIPVVMMTVMRQREVGQALGAVDYLIKPVDPKQLTETLNRHVKAGTANVLVVEDDEPTRDMISRTLEAAGHRIAEAENGKVALERIDEAIPDIIVLDLMMPVMDGFEFLRRLRAQPEYAELPVIVATARHLSPTERSELETVVKRVIEKNSVGRQELLHLIEHQITALLDSP